VGRFGGAGVEQRDQLVGARPDLVPRHADERGRWLTADRQRVRQPAHPAPVIAEVGVRVGREQHDAQVVRAVPAGELGDDRAGHRQHLLARTRQAHHSGPGQRDGHRHVVQVRPLGGLGLVRGARSVHLDRGGNGAQTDPELEEVVVPAASLPQPRPRTERGLQQRRRVRMGQATCGRLLGHCSSNRLVAARLCGFSIRGLGSTGAPAADPVAEERAEHHQRGQQQEQQVRRTAGHCGQDRPEHEGDGERHDREALALGRPALGRHRHPHGAGRGGMPGRTVEQQVALSVGTAGHRHRFRRDQ
jgi:hypothetical protein